jgi:hypothetical protein
VAKEVDMATAIQEFIEGRGVKSLFHFTRLKNLPSILQHGLLTKETCAAAGIDPEINDPYRYDGTGAISASISYPNYKMFYRLRCENPDVEWVVIKLKRSLLWRKKCAFSSTNAGDGSVFSIAIEQRQGLAPLKDMFTDFGDKKRVSLKIPDHYTTNPQAEVLLLEGAEVEDIKGVYFQRAVTQKKFEADYSSVACLLNGGYFDGRSDCAHWK